MSKLVNYEFDCDIDGEGDRPCTFYAAEDVARRDEQYLEALTITTKWIAWWLDLRECECENGHTCGYDERKAELAEAQRLLAELERGAP